MSGCRWVITPLWLSGSWRSFLCSSSVYSCYLFLISSASVRSKPFVFYCAHLGMKCSLGISNFLGEISSLSHSIGSLYFFVLVSFLSLLAILGTLHSNGCIFHFLLCLSRLFFSQLFIRPPQTTFAFFHFFFLGMVLVTASCIMSWTSVHSSSGTLSIISNPLNLFVIFPVNLKVFDLCHTWMA